MARSSFDYVEYPWYGALAGIRQAENSVPGYGQGAAGYGKRYGAAFADGTIENFMTGAALPSLLQEDPRFYQSRVGSFSHRAWYAASRILVTRTDSGHESFNFSEIVGSALSAGFNLFLPAPRRPRSTEHVERVGQRGRLGHDHHSGEGILARHSKEDPAHNAIQCGHALKFPPGFLYHSGRST